MSEEHESKALLPGVLDAAWRSAQSTADGLAGALVVARDAGSPTLERMQRAHSYAEKLAVELRDLGVMATQEGKG